MPANEKYVDLEFPLGGVSLLQEYQEQPPGTTPVGENVRGVNPDTLRERGGSRAGLVRYCPIQIPSGVGLIQHLNVIVDPTTDALIQNFEVPDDTWVEDPLNLGTFVPPGGWGVPPNPNATQPPDPTATLAFEQSAVEGFDTVSTEQTKNFTTTPGSGSLLLAFVATGDNDANTTVTVTNGSLAAYTQVGSYERFTKAGVEFTLSLWKRTASAGASEIAVKVTPSSECDVVVGALEFSGVNATPVGDSNSNTGNAATMTTGAITIDLGTECVVAGFLAGLSPDTVTPDAGFTLEIDHNDGTVDFTDIQLYVIYDLARAAGSVNAGATFSGGADDFAAIGVELKD